MISSNCQLMCLKYGKFSMILVTGGAGYIGSHTALALIKAGKEVVVIDSFVNSTISSIKAIEKITGKPVNLIIGDLRNENFLKSVFGKYEITDVIHFAGLKSVGESNRNPIYYYENNVTGTLNLIKVMGESGCKSLIFSSSATVYGQPETLPITEDFPLMATNPYGQSKLFIEQILRDLKDSDDHWNIVVLRYFNPAGAHSSGILGENSLSKPNNLFPLISRVAAGHYEYLEVFGGDYPTNDGTGIRDYIHINDLACGHIKALDILPNHPDLLTLNLGAGIGHSVIEIITEFEKVSNRRIPYKLLDRRSGDVAECYADASYAKKILGWETKLTLTDIVRDQWNWQRKTLMR